MIDIGIAGATGYTGIELVRLLHLHPETRLVAGTSERYAGQQLVDVFPHLGTAGELPLHRLEPERLAEQCQVVFLALPHGLSADIVARMPASTRIVDLGADFRLQDTDAYRRWYASEPPPGELLERAVYGLPELFRSQIREASLIANPGCYVTGCTLAAAPLLAEGLVDPESIVFDCKSGVSGAGRKASLGVHFSEVNDGMRAYKLAGAHRHTPEIEGNLSRVAGRRIVVTFSPHLAPMTRGILTTAYFNLLSPTTTEQVLDAVRSYYAAERFVRVRPAGDLPQTRHVWGSNYCDLGVEVDERTGRVIVVSALDNLVKGASGQAIQNMNLMLGLDEAAGLDLLPAFP